MRRLRRSRLLLLLKPDGGWFDFFDDMGHDYGRLKFGMVYHKSRIGTGWMQVIACLFSKGY